MSTYLKMENKDKEELVELTEHTLESVEEREDKIDENTIFLSKTVNGIEVEGKLNFVDDSDEVIKLTKISKWAKTTPHEKGSEISIEISMKDLNDEVYNEINYVKSFLHYYEEEFDLSNGTGSVRFFVRNKDDLETALGARVVKKDVAGESEAKEDFDVDVVPAIVPIEGAVKSDNYVTVYKEKTATKYDEADVVTNGTKRVKISIHGNNEEYDGYNHAGVTVVKGDVLNTLVGIIGTTVKAGTTVSDSDYYELKFYGQINTSKYKYTYDGSVTPAMLVFSKDISSVFPAEVYVEWTNSNGSVEKKTIYPNKNWGLAGAGSYSGSLKDSSGRYRVAVGPGIINASYPNNGQIWDGYDGINKDVELEIILKNVSTGSLKTLLAVVKDFKAHTYNKYLDGHSYNTGHTNVTAKDKNGKLIKNGILQTGISYPKSYNATVALAFAPKNIDGSIVEFTTSQKLDITVKDYILIDIKTKK